MFTLACTIVGTGIVLLYIGYMLQQEYEKGYSEGLAHGIEKGKKLEKSET